MSEDRTGQGEHDLPYCNLAYAQEAPSSKSSVACLKRARSALSGHWPGSPLPQRGFPIRTFMAPRSIVEGPKVSSAQIAAFAKTDSST